MEYIERVSPTGFGRVCDCGKSMLPSFSGHGYCLACGIPTDDFPLIPASATTKEFARVRKAWQRRTDRFGLVPMPESKLQEFIEVKRKSSTLLTSWSRASAKGRIGRPRALTGVDIRRLGEIVNGHAGLWTLKMLAELFVDKNGKHPHPRTIRRALKQLGVKPKHRTVA